MEDRKPFMEFESRVNYLFSTLVEHKRLLVIPVIAGVVLSILYVFLLRSESWTSRQRLLVREDLLGQSFKPGQFTSLDTMKLRQETILDIARNPEVVRNTLKQLGPKRTGFFFNPDKYPDNRTIEAVQGKISLSATNGAEFGKTEVVVLSVQESGLARSMEFIRILLDEVEKQVEEVHRTQLKSMETEAQLAYDTARESLQESLQQLREMEQRLGADSITMATMASVTPGDNSIKAEMLQIQSERRLAETELESLKTSKTILAAAETDPLLVMTTTSDFLLKQTRLIELARSFSEAERVLATASGKYRDIHPSVQNARENLTALQKQIASHLSMLTSSVNTQIHEVESRRARLDGLTRNHENRLIALSQHRGDHLAINAEIAQKNDILNQHETMLRNIQSYQHSKGNVVWVTRMGEPQPAAQPDGLSKRSIVMAGGLLGLLLGAGLVVLVAPPFQPATREVAETTSCPIEATRPAQLTTSAQSPTATPSRRPMMASAEMLAQPKAESHSHQDIVVKIPDVSENRELERIEKLIDNKSRKAKLRTSEPQPAEPQPVEPQQIQQALETVKQATAQLNVETVGQSEAPATELLQELRASRAIQTDPVSRPVLNPEPQASSVRLEEKISNLQRETAATVTPALSAASSVDRPLNPTVYAENPFIRKTSANAPAFSASPSAMSVPDQVKQISDSLVGLVQTRPR